MLSLEINVTGIVQGVFYRKSTLEKANALEIKGWVKNSPDGSVLIRAEGTKKSINEFLIWCKVGSENAKVNDVTIKEIAPEKFRAFKVLR